LGLNNKHWVLISISKIIVFLEKLLSENIFDGFMRIFSFFFSKRGDLQPKTSVY